MNNLKDFIVKNLIFIIIAAIIGGAIGSYLNYYFNNLSTENRNKEITKQLMLFIHIEIYENYVDKLSRDSLLGVEGLELINLRAGNLTIKDKQLSYLIKMYIHFSILNSRMNEFKEAEDSSEPMFIKSAISESVWKWRNICNDEIYEYEKEFCKDKSLKSEIEVE